MKKINNKYNVYEKKRGKVGGYNGLVEALTELVMLKDKKIEKIDCKKYKDAFGNLNCKVLRAMKKLEKDLQ